MLASAEGIRQAEILMFLICVGMVLTHSLQVYKASLNWYTALMLLILV
jgi:hypothetical protein